MNSMAGEQAQATSSPRDSEDVEIAIGFPKVFLVHMQAKHLTLHKHNSVDNYIYFIWCVGN